GLSYCEQNGSPIARIAQAGLRKLHRKPEAVEGAIEDAGANEVSKLRHNLRTLYGIAAIAPMLGLLGTVWGMIEAFQVASTKGLGKAEYLATGIYEALVTTFAGLLVAIPAVMFYYYFLGRIDGIIHDMNELSYEFVERYVEDEEHAARREPATAE
ncbi:MAG: MotA/TolQ/ExbB proton channel family protein, partial [Planctomycetota bacterium]